MNTDESIVILTGAGISKESGLDTFRDAGGIWARVRIEEVATPEAFAHDPVRVHEFYNHRRARLTAGNIEPNAAHFALARLEADWPGEVLVVTQNIDDLHERAGSRNLVHMHGQLLKVRCQACGRTGGMRPDVVWFGEMPMAMERIYAALESCLLFASIGTSGNVYPAAGFVQHVIARARVRTVEMNLEPSQGASLFGSAVYGPATQTVPEYVEKLLCGG